LKNKNESVYIHNMKTRRTFIQSAAMASAGLLASKSFAFSVGNKGIKPAELIIGHNGFTYKVDSGWAKISASTHPVNNCHEMIQDSQGRLILVGDDTKNNILIFDKSGQLLDSWGTSYPAGHGLSISKENGEDFLLIVDNGFYTDLSGAGKSQPGNVIKTNVKGRIIFTLPQPHAIGVYKDDEGYHPTETAIAPNGDIYVADGYGSDYILHFDSKGRFIRKFGGHNNDNKEHNLQCAHGVVVDTRDKENPVLICTSREECCFKVFTLDGKFIKRLDTPGMYVCRPVIHGQHLYAGVCWSKDKEGKQLNSSGFLTILDTNYKVLASPGGTAPIYKNGVLQQTFQHESKVFHHGHDVCIDEDDSIYVAQWNANKTTPIKLTRV
jgi:hypothetical protein